MHNEQVFTPNHFVRTMLDVLRYDGVKIVNKHIIDNSCGEGAFLTEAVERYCCAWTALKMENIFSFTLAESLSKYIHGIEIDKDCAYKCIDNLNNVVKKYTSDTVNWDIKTGDALLINDYNGKMDYVVGNPPYCKVHDFGERYDSIKQFSFADGGMTDLYLVFFEIGINMLSEKGQLMYITPSSWTTSLAGRPFRKYLLENDVLDCIITMGHTQIFDDADTYTMVTLISKDRIKDRMVTMYRYNEQTRFVDYIATRDLSVFASDDEFYFTDDTQIVSALKRMKMVKRKYVSVKNGFATLNDKLFVLPSDDTLQDKSDVISAVKASTGKWHKMIFPYDEEGKEKMLSDETVDYMIKRMDELDKKYDSDDVSWMRYGRIQAINDVQADMRFSVSNLFRDKDDLKLWEVRKGEGVFGGLYILPSKGEEFTLDDIHGILYTDEFIRYVKVVGTPKSGGYYWINTKKMEIYLNFAIENIKKVTKP